MNSRIDTLLSGLGVSALSHRVFEVRKEPKGWRSELLTTFGDICPTKVLWSRESLSDNGFEPIPTLPNCWRIDSQNDAEDLLGQMYEGGWGLFFGEEGTLFADSTPPEYLPMEVGAIEDLLESTGAQAIILSWYDDNEWTVAISC